MSVHPEILFFGFPGKANNTFLGWSSIALLQSNGVNCLFDTGGHGARPNLIRALEDRNLSLNDIDIVFLSHLHFDHCANVSLFPQATFCFSAEEWEHANLSDDLCVQEGILPQLRVFKKKLLKNDGEEIFKGAVSYFTPGHTPGSTSLICEGEEGRYALCGDAIKNRSELEMKPVAMTLCAEQSEESIKKIKKLSNRVLPGHDCWLYLEENDRVVPHGDNDILITFPEGITINGDTTVRLRID